MAVAAKLGAMRKSRMSEELKGNQHKIDANKNNKIDAHDFKLLRSKLKVKKEEVEQVDEVIGNTTGYSDSGPRNKADERKFHQMRNVVTKGSRTGKITKYAQNRLKARLKDKTYMDK